MKNTQDKFNAPVVGGNIPRREVPFLRWVGKSIFSIFGWGFKHEFPDIPKFVVIIGPHTSNWDFVFGIAAIFILGVNVSWMGKHSIFRKPFGPILQWLGGIPINRSSTHGVVDTLVNKYNHMDQFILALAPEGTRKKVAKWKSGFYHIAAGANVPILMAGFDYEIKRICFGPLIHPSGDVAADMEKMQMVFKKIRGKRNRRVRE